MNFAHNTKRDPSLAKAMEEAQDRHRRLENTRVEREERELMDGMHRDIKKFLEKA